MIDFDSNSLQILYVTSLWSGLDDLIFKGFEEASGMPAFVQPVKRLIELGHKVDFIVTIPNHRVGSLNCKAEWLQASRIHPVLWENKSHYGRLRSCYRLYRKVLEIIAQRKHNFCYGHGSVSGIGCLVAQNAGVPCGARLYGSFLASKISKSPRWKIIVQHPLEFLAFTTRKDFLIVTDDGSRGDFVYRELNRNSKSIQEFHFLWNGVDRCIEEDVDSDKVCPPTLFYPGRIAPWKQQHLALRILRELHDHGHSNIELHLAGHITCSDYWEDIKRQTVALRLSDSVKYLGLLPKSQMRAKYKKSLAVLSFYKDFNLGNVVLEAFAEGGIVITFPDESVSKLITDGQTGFLVSTPSEAVARLLNLARDEHLCHTLKCGALKEAASKIDSWETRANREVGIIINSVKAGGFQQST